MSLEAAFRPTGPLVLVGTSIVQVADTTNSQHLCYRVRCLVTGYLSWAPAVSPNVAPTAMTAAAPSNGVNSPNTIGMQVGQTETFRFPWNCYFISSVVAGFEIVIGEGV